MGKENISIIKCSVTEVYSIVCVLYTFKYTQPEQYRVSMRRRHRGSDVVILVKKKMKYWSLIFVINKHVLIYMSLTLDC